MSEFKPDFSNNDNNKKSDDNIVKLTGEPGGEISLSQAENWSKLINKGINELTVADVIYAQGIEMMIQRGDSREEINKKLVEFGYNPDDNNNKNKI